MKQQAYYRNVMDNKNDYAVSDTWLIVNCTGCQVMSRRYVADSVRKDYFLLYMVKGKIHVNSGGLSAVVTPGQCIIFTPGVPFFYEGGADRELVYLWVHFSGSAAEEVLEKCGLTCGGVFYAGRMENASSLFHSLFRAFSKRDSFYQMDAVQHLLALLTLLGRALQHAQFPDSGSANPIEASIRYIHEHFREPLTLRQLADMEYLSVSRYRTVFTDMVGVPPYEYILLQRINRACDLLRHSPLSIAEIAGMTGHADQRYFSRLFRSKTGMSPHAYRNLDPLE
ncbi:MAG: transcriptional regulator, AraC family [Paenibacillaceae bacterium]|jgi:AraC-like DNA-binding protein|nr:transcriptional regulator, AraC family [Paenibacillaceae bacterium]